MPDIYEHSLTVPPEAIDRLGHVNNLAYLGWMLDAAVAHSAAQGWTAERYEELGSVWVVRSHEIKYIEPAYEGEELVVVTWVADMTRVSSTRRYRIERASSRAAGAASTTRSVLAKAATRWAFIDRSRGTLTRIPRELIDSFALVPDP